MGTRQLDIETLIDDHPFGAHQVTAMLLCALVALLDGIDSQSIAVGVPLIVGELGLARTAIGPILSAALLGAALGAMTFGPLGDRYGRKSMLVVAASTFGAFTVATAYADSYGALLAVRFLAGIGLGGATPCFLALSSEFAPARSRGAVASLIWAAFPVGAMAGGFINAYILRVADWRTMFLVGGIAPLVVVALLLLFLPESIRFLLVGNRDPARARRIAARVRPGLPADAVLVAHEVRHAGAPLRQLFARGRAVTTLLLWVPFITAFGTLAIVAYWTPALLRENGISPSDTAFVLGVQSIGSILGMASAGRIMERLGSAAVLGASLAGGAVATGAIGFFAGSVMSVALVEAVSCFFVGMGASGSIALAALVYPTALRSTGIGWAMGMGRAGQVVATLVIGLLVAFGWDSREVFMALGFAPLLGALSVMAMRWHTRRVPATEAVA